jgi:hypothetical protein
MPCDIECGSCYDFGPNNCLTCKVPKIYDDGKCILISKPGYYAEIKSDLIST